jgi:hypothetical protein
LKHVKPRESSHFSTFKHSKNLPLHDWQDATKAELHLRTDELRQRLCAEAWWIVGGFLGKKGWLEIHQLWCLIEKIKPGIDG